MGRLWHRAGLAYDLVPGLLLMGCAVLTLADVTGRNLFNQPVPGATELTEIAVVAITFLLYPRVAWANTHISVDLLDNVLGRMVRHGLEVLAAVLAAGVFGVLAWRLWVLAGRVADYGDITPYLRLPLAPVYYGMAICTGVAAIVHGLRALGLVGVPGLMPASPWREGS
ncbi:TRAP transporter small permease [Pontitalea aquivivens]|uniref:TRAP transporter small permease n=1 Tax=Pontitalea aquivivens TaxID=3388663 RepID=UPI003970D9A9